LFFLRLAFFEKTRDVRSYTSHRDNFVYYTGERKKEKKRKEKEKKRKEKLQCVLYKQQNDARLFPFLLIYYV
jgi:hypothetical protein